MIAPVRSKVEYLGTVRGALKSLEEIAEPMLRALERIDKRQQERGHISYKIGPLFSSRGSLPFISALEYLTREDGPKSHITVNPIPFIFSTENFIEIITGWGKLGVKRPDKDIQQIIDGVYGELVLGLNTKIAEAGFNEDDILTDWDEVKTGANLRERMKIYNQLTLPHGLEFCVVSVIGNSGKDLKKFNVAGIKRLLKQSPREHTYLDIKAKEEVSWSDQETFYRNIGLVYPGIAAPELDTVRNIVRRKDLPFFYARFFKHYNDGLARELGRDPTEVANGIVTITDGRYGVYNAEQFILKTSLDAYVLAMSDIQDDSDRSFKVKIGPLEGEFRIDIDNGIVIRTKYNGKDQVVLRRKTNDSDRPQRIPYRTPFTLLTRKRLQPTDALMDSMEQYFRENHLQR